MSDRLRIAWHVYRHGHNVRVNRHISVPLFDQSAKGWLWECECGKTAAR
jgi:hypothetical protein